MNNMKQICDGYNPKVLMGNWYEQSYSVPQPARDEPCKVARSKQVDIGFIDNRGKLRALNTVSRLQPWNTSNLVTTSEFNYEKEKPFTTNKQNFDLPTVNNFHCTFKAQPFTKSNRINENNKTYMQVDKFNRKHNLFNQKNCNQLLIERQSDSQSFKSNLKPNVHLDNKEFMQSIYQMQISQPQTFLKINRPQNNRQKEVVDNKQRELSNFRRIRSQITLKTTTNFPFTCK